MALPLPFGFGLCYHLSTSFMIGFVAYVCCLRIWIDFSSQVAMTPTVCLMCMILPKCYTLVLHSTVQVLQRHRPNTTTTLIPTSIHPLVWWSFLHCQHLCWLSVVNQVLPGPGLWARFPGMECVSRGLPTPKWHGLPSPPFPFLFL